MSDIRCVDCGRPMVSQRVHRQDPAGWRARGYVRHNAGDLCIGCYARARQHGHRRRRVRTPKITIATSYTVSCEKCGQLGTATHRKDAERLQAEHKATHNEPARPPLTDAEVNRLRAMVGFRGAA